MPNKIIGITIRIIITIVWLFGAIGIGYFLLKLFYKFVKILTILDRL